MSRKRHRSRRPKGKRHKRILNSVKEEVVQLRAMGLTYNDIADKTNLGYSTIEHICLRWAPANPDRVKIARAKALEELAGRVSAKAIEAIEHITPDSMTHDRVEQYNAAGDLIGVQHSGPNAPQLMTTAGIAIDKALQLTDKAEKLRGDQPDVLGPTDYMNLLATIEGRLTRLTDVKADINTGEIKARILELKDAADDDDKALEVEYEVVEE